MNFDNDRRNLIAGAATLVAAATAAPFGRAYAQGSTNKSLELNIINSGSTGELAFEKLLRTRGYLEEMGVKATTVNVTDGTKIMASLVSGKMDVSMKTGLGQVSPAVEHGAALKIIAGAITLTPQGVLTNNENIRSVSDLKGKTVGTGPLGTLEHQLMIAVLLKHGVDPVDVNFVNVGNSTSIFRAIVAGVVDAGPVNVDVYGRLKGHLRIISNFWTDLPEYPNQGSFASDAAIETKRDAIVHTLAAYCKMYRFLGTPESKNPYIAAYLAAVGGSASDAELQWRFLYDNKVFAYDLVIPDSSLDLIQGLNLRTGNQKKQLPLAKFVDMSLAHEALELAS